jgi:hypothetical protein
VNAEVPEPVVEQARAAFGITPTLERYDEVMRPYRELEILYEDRCELALEPADEIERYCDATIKRFEETTADLAPDAITAAKNRLRAVRLASNALRPYQRYSVLVLRYRQATYPARYVELF